MLAIVGEVLMRQQFVQRRAQLQHARFQPAELRDGIVRHQLGDDDARLVQHDVTKRDAFGDRVALDHRRVGFRNLELGLGARDRAGDEVLGDDHRGGLKHLDVFVLVFL